MIENRAASGFLNGRRDGIWHKQPDVGAYLSFTADKKFTKISK